jgi:hypothetical protein
MHSPSVRTNGGSQHIYSDEMPFIQDQHEFYDHWPAEVWEVIESHEVNRE